MSSNLSTIKELRASLYSLSWELSGKYPLKIYKEMINKEVSRLCIQEESSPELEVFNPGDLVCTFDNLSVNDHTTISQWTRKGVAPRNPYVNNAIINVLISNLDENRTIALSNKLLNILRGDYVSEFITGFNVNLWIEYLSHVTQEVVSSDVMSKVGSIYRSIMESVYSYKDIPKRNISDTYNNVTDSDNGIVNKAGKGITNPADNNIAKEAVSDTSNGAGNGTSGVEEYVEISEPGKDSIDQPGTYKKIPKPVWLISGAILITIAIYLISLNISKSNGTSVSVADSNTQTSNILSTSESTVNNTGLKADSADSYISTTSETLAKNTSEKLAGTPPSENTSPAGIAETAKPGLEASHDSSNGKVEPAASRNNENDIKTTPVNSETGSTKASNHDTNTQNLDNSIKEAGEWIYNTCVGKEGRGLYKMRPDKSNQIKISDNSASGIIVVGDYIYYLNSSGDNEIYKVKTDGSEEVPLNFVQSDCLTAIGNYIYYIAYYKDKSQICKMSVKDGVEEVLLECRATKITKLAFRKDWIFYGIQGQGIFKMDMAGKHSEMSVECAPDDELIALAVDDENIYYKYTSGANHWID